MKIVVPIKPESVQALPALLDQLDERVDVIELWLENLIQELITYPFRLQQTVAALQAAKQRCQAELLCVCKTPAEQGAFRGTPQQRIQILQQALRFGADYVDIDVSQNPANLIAVLPPQKLWLSWHDFEQANTDIVQAKFEHMQVFKPAVYKFAVTPQSEAQLQNFISWAKAFPETGIFTTMGPLGASGRSQLKSETYAAFYALSPEFTTASGQPTLNDL